jgi:hypothetical protein
MSGIDVVMAITILIVFLFGIMFGLIVIVSRASNREDKHYSVKGTPPDNACGGARRLVGFSHRDWDRQPPPEDALPWGRAGERSSHGWGDER